MLIKNGSGRDHRQEYWADPGAWYVASSAQKYQGIWGEGGWVFICLLWVVLYECGSGQFKKWPSVHAPDVTVHQAAWGSVPSGPGHGFVMIIQVLIMFKIQIVSSGDALPASVYLGSSTRIVKVVYFCILQENRTEAPTQKPESLAGFVAIKIQTYSPKGLNTHIDTLHFLSCYKTRSLCAEVQQYCLFCSLFCCCVPVKTDNKMKYFNLSENDCEQDEMTGDKQTETNISRHKSKERNMTSNLWDICWR